MLGRSKSTRVAPVETSSLEPSLGCNSSVYGKAPWILKDGGAQGQLQSRPVETIVDVNEVAVVSVTSSIQECGFRRNKCICECPIMNNSFSFDETVWVASRIYNNTLNKDPKKGETGRRVKPWAWLEWIRRLGNEAAGWVLVEAPGLLNWVTSLSA